MVAVQPLRQFECFVLGDDVLGNCDCRLAEYRHGSPPSGRWSTRPSPEQIGDIRRWTAATAARYARDRAKRVVGGCGAAIRCPWSGRGRADRRNTKFSPYGQRVFRHTLAGPRITLRQADEGRISGRTRCRDGPDRSGVCRLPGVTPGRSRPLPGSMTALSPVAASGPRSRCLPARARPVPPPLTRRPVRVGTHRAARGVAPHRRGGPAGVRVPLRRRFT